MVYDDLDHSRDEIRLLRLAPRSSKATSSRKSGEPGITCTFQHTDLLHYPSFEALSYAWGSRNGTKFITVNNSPFHVTTNLHSALKHLQHDTEQRLLWVDALCINQQDVAERNIQVAHMRDIYNQASRVIVWLGEASEEGLIAMDLIDLMAQDTESHILPSLNPHVSVSGMDLSSQRLRRCLVSFFELPWWWRVWTVQEFSLGRDVVFQYGQRLLSEVTLTGFLANFKRHVKDCCRQGHQLNEEVHPSSNSSVMSIKNRFEALLRARELRGTEKFLELLAMFRIRESSDDRDKIYGLIGLAGESFTSLISPDYTCATEELYELTAFALIRSSGNLDVLSHLYHTSTAGLPSFVPDWRAAMAISHSKYMFRLASLNLYQASGDRKAQVRRVSPKRLAINAVLFDRIAEILPGKGRKSKAEKLRRYRALAGVEDETDLPYCTTSHSVEEAFARTLFGDVKATDEGLFVDRRMVAEDLPLVRVWQAFDPKDNQSSSSTRNLYHLSSVFDVMTGGRAFLRTTKGYIGFGPRKAREGDFVAVMPGGKMPYILRPLYLEASERLLAIEPGLDLEKSHIVLGDAYIHGIMDGEAFELAENIEESIQEVLLV